jgi:hypothetical protein
MPPPPETPLVDENFHSFSEETGFGHRAGFLSPSTYRSAGLPSHMTNMSPSSVTGRQRRKTPLPLALTHRFSEAASLRFQVSTFSFSKDFKVNQRISKDFKEKNPNPHHA